MKIVSFTANNFKRLTAVEITPEGNVITLKGVNGAGKSSVLDGIEASLAGRDAVCEKPIRDGASRGTTVTRLSNGFVVTRVFTPGGSTLKIELGDDTIKTPQAVLDKLTGALTFDPLAFATMKPAEQADTLRRLVGVDFSKTDAATKREFDLRTEVNRDVERDAARLAGMKMFEGAIPDLPVQMQDVLDAIQKAQAINKAADAAVEALDHAKRNREGAAASVQEALSQIAQWQKVLAERQNVVQKYRAAEMEFSDAADKANAQRVNTAELNAKLLTIETTNQMVRQKQERTTCQADIIAGRTRADTLTKEIDALKATKEKILREAKFPLEGLTFDSGGVFYKSQPFAQISSGEQLRVSVAIGMALNPTLRIIFVRNGSLLDQAGLKLIGEMAKEQDYQLWMEDTRSTDPGAIIIEDGHVAPVSISSSGGDVVESVLDKV